MGKKKLLLSKLDWARDRYEKARSALLSHMRSGMYKGMKLSQDMQREKDMVEVDLDDWVKLNPNFPLSHLRRSEFGDKIKWGKTDHTGQLDPIPHEFWSAHANLYAEERNALAGWKA